MFLRLLIFLTLLSLPFYVIRFEVFGLPTTALEITLLVTVIAWLIIPKSNTLPLSSLAGRRKLQIIRSYYLRSCYLGAKQKLKESWKNLKPYRVPILLFIIASFIAVFVSPNKIPALGHWRAFILEPLLWLLVFADTIKTEKDQRAAILALGLSLAIPTAIALYQQATGNLIPNKFWADAATRRVTSIYGYPNAYALYAVPTTILLLSLMRSIWNSAASDRTLLRRAAFLLPASSGTILALLSIASIFFTRSKGGIAALLVGSGILIVRELNKKITIGMVAVSAIIALLFLRQINISGFSTVPGGDSISVRLTQYRETWEMLKDRPFTGAGLRGYQTAMIPYHTQKHIEIFLYPHNIFLAMWSELGLLGLVSFLWLIVIFFKTTFSLCHSRESGNPDNKNKQKNRFWFLFSGSSRSRSGMTIEQCNNVTIKQFNHAAIQPFNHAATAAMAAILVHGLVDVPYFKNDLAVLFWTLISLTVRQDEKNVLQSKHEAVREKTKK